LPIFTQEVIWTLSLELIAISLLVFLIYQNARKYLQTDYSRPLLIFVLVLFAFLISRVITFGSLFLSQGNENLYLYGKQLGLISAVFSISLLFLLFELFEHEALFTELQMLNTIFTTVVALIVLVETPEGVWLESEQFFDVNLDYLTNFLIIIFPVVMGIIIIYKLRRTLKDVWITQRNQLILMIVGVSVISFVPLGFVIIALTYLSSLTFFSYTLMNAPVILGFIIISISFGNTKHYSLYYRRKADKILITNLNGIPLFHYDFKENVHYINETLFSGAVVAITMLMSESIKSSSPIAEVLMKNKYRLMLETKQSFIALVLTPQANKYLRDSLERFAVAFDLKFTSLITSGEILDLNLFVKSGLGVLFENFGIPTKNVQDIIARLTFEETLT
jgi:hypothetical protein